MERRNGGTAVPVALRRAPARRTGPELSVVSAPPPRCARDQGDKYRRSAVPPFRLPERSGTHLIHPMERPGLLLRLPEPELLGPAVRLQLAAAEGDEAGGAGGDDAELAEVGETAIDGGRPLGDDALCTLRADAGYAQQLLVRSGTYFDRESLGVRQRPRRLRIGVEREIPALVIDELLRAEAVVAEEVVGLVKPVLAERGCGRMGFERSLADRAERAELEIGRAHV